MCDPTLSCMNDLSFSRSASRPTNRPELAPRENNCLACVYTVVWVVVVAVVGVEACRGVRGVKDLPPTCTRCLGVIGGDSSASRYRGLEGVLNWTGSVFSSVNGLALAHDLPFLRREKEGITIHSLGCRLGFRVNLGRRSGLGGLNRVFRASSLNDRRILGLDFIVFLLVFFDNLIAIPPPRTQLARRDRRLVFFLENTRCSSSTLAGSAHR